MTTSEKALPPFSRRVSIVEWVRENLLQTWYNALLTIVGLGLVFWMLRGLLTWAINQARWEVVVVNFRLLMIGQYPIAQVWRLWFCLHILAFIVGMSLAVWGRKAPRRSWMFFFVPAIFALFPFGLTGRLNLVLLSVIAFGAWWIGKRLPVKTIRRPTLIGWVIYFPIVILLVSGLTERGGVFPKVGTNLWGGLLLTFLLTVVGIVFSFPIGVFLALGRQSQLPLIRWFSIFYIEVVRGVPLITVLFMAQLMLPLFLPANVTIDRILRAMVGITLFSAAYLAENVRGGLQAIPRGQFEAAHALGLSGFQSMAFIILPQALRLVIPILVGQFISLFKDTALVSIVGLFDLLGIADTVLAQPNFIGLQREVYVFISLIYWIFSYAMSYVSQRLETYLGVGIR